MPIVNVDSITAHYIIDNPKIKFYRGFKYLSLDSQLGRWVAIDHVNGLAANEFFKEKTDALRWLND